MHNVYQKEIETTVTWHDARKELPKKDGQYLVTEKIACRIYYDVIEFAKNGNKVDEYDLHNQRNIFYTYDSEYGFTSTNNVIYWAELPPLPSELER